MARSSQRRKVSEGRHCFLPFGRLLLPRLRICRRPHRPRSHSHDCHRCRFPSCFLLLCLLYIYIYTATTARCDRHRQDSAPLLGEGELSLQDPEDPSTTPQPPTDYGATGDDDDNNKKDDKKEEAASSSAPPPSKTKTHAVPKGKKKNKSGGDGRAGTRKKKEEEEDDESPTDQLAHKPHVPSVNPCLWLFHLLQGLSAITSLLLLVSQILPLVLPSSKTAHMDVLSAVLKVYVSLICLAFCVVEAELPVPFVRRSTLLDSFVSRGFIYTFVGLVCTTEAYSERVDDLMTHSNQRFYIGWVAIFMEICAWVMFGIGVVYMALGVSCTRGLRDRMKQHEQDAWRQYREDMRAWKRSHKN